MASTEQLLGLLENGNLKGLSKEMRHGRTAHNRSSTSLRKKSDLTLVSKVRCGCLRLLLTNLQEVFLGTKLSILFPAIPLAIIAHCYGFGRVSALLINVSIEKSNLSLIEYYYYICACQE